MTDELVNKSPKLRLSSVRWSNNCEAADEISHFIFFFFQKSDVPLIFV